MINTLLFEKYIVNQFEDDRGECVIQTDMSKKFKFQLSKPFSSLDSSIQPLIDKIKSLTQFRHPSLINIADCGIVTLNQLQYYCLLYPSDAQYISMTDMPPMSPSTWIKHLLQLLDIIEVFNLSDIRNSKITPEQIFFKDSQIFAASFAFYYLSKLNKAIVSKNQNATNLISLSEYLYFTPEQTSDEDIDDIEAMIYRLGLISYYALTHQHAFESKSSYEIMKLQLTAILPKIEHDGLYQLLLQMTHKDPKQRISMTSLKKELQQILMLESKSNQKLTKETLDDDQPSRVNTAGTPDFIGQRYKIVKILGKGGFGTVYHALDTKIADRSVAVKLLNVDTQNNPKIAELFEKEARVMSRLSHSNTLRLLDFGKSEQGIPYMVSELLKGYPLDVYIEEKGQLEPLESLEIILNISEALGDAHREGIIHRDIKPENIFLTPTNQRKKTVKLLDFGIAKIKEGAQLTIAGGAKTQGVMGTPFYMSPEQHDTTHAVDARTDIYSLGIVLYQCLTGQVPFQGETYFQIVKQHKEADIPKIEAFKNGKIPIDIINDINSLIHQMLEKQRENRIQSIEQVIVLIENLIDKIKRISPSDAFLPLNTPAPLKSGSSSSNPPNYQTTKQLLQADQASKTTQKSNLFLMIFLIAVVITASASIYFLYFPKKTTTLGLNSLINVNIKKTLLVQPNKEIYQKDDIIIFSLQTNDIPLQNVSYQVEPSSAVQAIDKNQFKIIDNTLDKLQAYACESGITDKNQCISQTIAIQIGQGEKEVDNTKAEAEENKILLSLEPNKIEYLVGEKIKLKVKNNSEPPSFNLDPPTIGMIKNNSLTFKATGKGKINACVKKNCTSVIPFRVVNAELPPE